MKGLCNGTPFYGREDFASRTFGWLVVLRQYFSLYRAVSQREGERKEKQQTREKCPNNPHPVRTYCKRSRPLPYYNPN